MSAILGDEVMILRQLMLTDIDGNYAKWFNDAEIVRNNRHGRFPMTRGKLERYVTGADGDPTLLVLAVIMRDSGEHVGNISLQNIDWIDRRAEIAFVLGEKEWHGKGVMLRAGNLLIRHAFDALNLQRVYCGTLDTNVSMKRLAAKLGMREEGKSRKHIFKNGEYIDVVWFGVLKENYQREGVIGK